MNIYFQYNSKSRGQNIPRAYQIAEDLGYETEHNFNIIEFDSPDDPALVELYQLVGNLKGSEIFIKEGDQKEILDSSKFFKTLACENKLLCSGICTHITISKLSLEDFFETYGHLISDNTLTVYDTNLIEAFAPFLKKDAENNYIIDKDLLLEYFKETAISENRFCNKYDQNLLIEKIGNLPSLIQYIPLSNMRQNFRESFVTKEIRQINRIFANIVLDNTLTPQGYIEAIKAITLIKSDSYPIKDSDIWIASEQNNGKQEVVLWRVVQKKFKKEEKMEALLTRKEDMYLIESPIAQVYFILTEETDGDLETHLKTLKGL
jgi:hypothetical protein